MGRNEKAIARHVARTICIWAFFTGCLLTVIMLCGQSVFAGLLVPAGAMAIFAVLWWIASLSQPVNSIAFATDGIHWGTGDFAYLRNGMIAAASVGLLGIYLLESSDSDSVELLWIVTVAWIFVRAVAGVIRIWPGIGLSPLVKR